MSDHEPSPMTRRCDVCVVGGSAAGLAGALQLVRRHRSVIVVDAGDACNAPAAHPHGHLGHDGATPADPVGRERDAVRSHGGEVLDGRVETVERAVDGDLAVQLMGGHRIVARRVLIATGLGDVLGAGPTGASSVAGVYAAGNVTDPGQQLLQAAAQGSRVGAMIALDLADDDTSMETPRPPVGEAEWDERYGGDAVWSGRPNGSLVAEVAALAPGRALDVGAGEGGDACWLAGQGWTVTASDISSRGLDHIAHVAKVRGVDVTTLHANANAPGAYPVAAFDLVTACYASIPRTPDHRAVRNIVGAVAPEGSLVVVSHDLTAPTDGAGRHHGHGPDPDDGAGPDRPGPLFDPQAYERVEEFADLLASSPEWRIEVHEKRPRPAGAVSTHHVDDVVLRARRTG